MLHEPEAAAVVLDFASNSNQQQVCNLVEQGLLQPLLLLLLPLLLQLTAKATLCLVSCNGLLLERCMCHCPAGQQAHLVLISVVPATTTAAAEATYDSCKHF